jgi:hypothetical protein
VEQKKGTLVEDEEKTLMEEKEKPKTPLQSALKERESKKAHIKNVVGETTMSLSNCNI